MRSRLNLTALRVSIDRGSSLVKRLAVRSIEPQLKSVQIGKDRPEGRPLDLNRWPYR